MPIEQNLIGMTIDRRLDNLNPKIMVPAMYTDLGQRDSRCREIWRSFRVVIGVDQMT